MNCWIVFSQAQVETSLLKVDINTVCWCTIL